MCVCQGSCRYMIVITVSSTAPYKIVFCSIWGGGSRGRNYLWSVDRRFNMLGLASVILAMMSAAISIGHPWSVSVRKYFSFCLCGMVGGGIIVGSLVGFHYNRFSEFYF